MTAQIRIGNITIPVLAFKILMTEHLPETPEALHARCTERINTAKVVLGESYNDGDFDTCAIARKSIAQNQHVIDQLEARFPHLKAT